MYWHATASFFHRCLHTFCPLAVVRFRSALKPRHSSRWSTGARVESRIRCLFEPQDGHGYISSEYCLLANIPTQVWSDGTAVELIAYCCVDGLAELGSARETARGWYCDAGRSLWEVEAGSDDNPLDW